jgi:thiol-disulfide isomerase/thioredoxin
MSKAVLPIAPREIFTRRAGSFCLVLTVFLLGCWTEEENGSAHAVPAQPAPDFILPQLEGGAVVSLEDLAGKIVVLDLWATWCPPCALQVPVLNAFYEAHRAEGDVVLYGVSVDQVGVDEIREWVNEHGVLYPNLVGGDPLSRELGAVGFPALFVIDPKGRLQARHEGVIERETLEQFLADQRAAKTAG